jgi:hypothetical protein
LPLARARSAPTEQEVTSTEQEVTPTKQEVHQPSKNCSNNKHSPIKAAVQHKHTAFIGLFSYSKDPESDFCVLKFGDLAHSYYFCTYIIV